MIFVKSLKLNFPLGAEFKFSPKLLIYKYLFKDIKKYTCLSNGLCQNCNRKKIVFIIF